MSVQKRKLSYWGIDFASGDTHFFDSGLFCRFVEYVNSLPNANKLFRDEKNNKAVALSSIRDETKQELHLYKITFKSCKYNHSPDYMSSADGSERPTDKQLYEGDKELTHMCMRIDGTEAYTIFEERKNGVSMGGVIKYLNKHLHAFLTEQGLTDNFYLWANIIPPVDFLTALDSADRISIAQLFVEKRVLGSGFLNLMDVDANSQDDLLMTLKSKPRQSLPKRALRQAFQSLTTEGSEISRIRLYGKDINKMNVMIDSLGGKRVEEVTVDLTPNGVVDSYSIFAKIEEVLGVTE